jgi:hypothetical protein
MVLPNSVPRLWSHHFPSIYILIPRVEIRLKKQQFTMRLNYIPDPPNFTSPDDQAVVERVKQRRGDKGLIALDKTLLHAPPVADGW